MSNYVKFRHESPDHYAQFEIAVQGKALSKNKVLEILKDQNIDLNALEKKEEINSSIDGKKVVIKITPLTEKNYLKSVETLIPIHQNWLERLASAFVRLTKWIFRIEERAKIDETELAFAMHLFRNADNTLFEKLTNSSSGLLEDFQRMRLPLSDVLGIWIHFFEESIPCLSREEQKAFEDFLPALRDLQMAQKQVEEIRSIKKKSNRVKAREKLEKDLLEKAEEALKGDDSKPFFMPGGYVDPKTGNNVQMIYELTKRDDGTIRFRVVDLSGTLSIEQDAVEDAMEINNVFSLIQGKAPGKRLAPSVSGDIDELEEFMERALQAQIGPPHVLYQQNVSKWDAIKILLFGFQGDEYPFSRKSLVTMLPSGELSAGDAPTTVKKREVVESPKLMEIFFKTTYPDLYKGKKTLLKISAFFSLYRQLERRMGDPEIRQWMRDNAEALLLQVEKTEEGKNPFGNGSDDTERAQRDVKYIKNELTKILEAIADCDQKQALRVPKAPGKQKRSHTAFNEKMHMPHLAKCSAFRPIGAQVAPAAPLRAIKLENLGSTEARKAIYDSCLEGLKSIQRQVDNKKWDNSTVLLEDMSRSLELLQESGIIDHITAEEAKEWSGFVRDFGLISAQVSYGLGYIVPTAAFIHYNLQSLVFIDKLLRKHDPTKSEKKPEGIYQKYQFAAAPVEQVLKDPYLSLGSKGPAIEKALSYLKSPPGADAYALSVRLTNGDGMYKPCYRYDNRFFSDVGDALGIVEIDRMQLYAAIDEKGPLPAQIVHMRQLYLITQTLLAPTRTYIAQGVGNFLGAGLHILDEVQIGGVLAGQENFTGRMYPNSVKQVIKRIQTQRGPLRFKVKLNWFGYGNQFVIEPYGLAVQDFDDEIVITSGDTRFAFPHQRLYKDNGLDAGGETIEKVLFEQAVAQKDVDLIDDEGKRAYTDDDVFENVKYQPHSVNGKMQLAIMREKLTLMGLSSDVIQELQLMHTGEETRVKEAVGKLCKYIGLLNAGKDAPTLQRLFEACIFRDRSLIQQLRKDPGYARVLFEQLREAAEKQKGAHQYRSYLYAIDVIRRVQESLGSVEISEGVIFDPMKSEMENYLKTAQQEIQELSRKADAGKKPYARYQRELHMHQLLSLAHRYDQGEDELNLEQLERILESFCRLQSVPSSAVADPDQEARLAYFMHRIRPKIKEAMEDFAKRDQVCNHVLHFLLPQEKSSSVWKVEGKSGFLFKAGKYTIDLKAGVLWENGARQCPIPKAMLAHPDFDQIAKVLKESGFEEDLSALSARLEVVEKDGVLGRSFAFNLSRNGEAVPFRLIDTEDHVLRVYKKAGSSWYQLQTEIVAPRKDEKTVIDQAKAAILGGKPFGHFPRELQGCACWVRDDGKAIRAEKKGKVAYIGKLKGSPPEISSLMQNESKLTVLNPWRKKSFQGFQSLDDPAHITVRGKNGQASALNYNRFNLSYRWSEEKQAWISPEHPRHFLSARTLREYFTGNYDSELHEIFAGSFQYYQFLESENGWPKVVMSATELTRLDPEKNAFVMHLQKRSKRLHQVFEVDKKQRLPLFTYTADPNRGLVCDDVPDGYLYLAYVLYAQGKYKEAIRYLKKADLNRPLSETGNAVIGWIQSFSDQSPGAAAFKMHVTLMLIHQAEIGQQFAKASQAAQQLGVAIAAQVRQYNAFVEAEKIPFEWQLQDQDLADVHRYGEKSIYYVGCKIIEHKDTFRNLAQTFQGTRQANRVETVLEIIKIRKILNEMHITFDEIFQWYQTGILGKLLEEGVKEPKAALDELIAYEMKHRLRLKHSLQKEIEELEAIIQKREKEPVEDVEAPAPLKKPIRLLPFGFNKHFKKHASSPGNGKNWEKLHASFREAATSVKDLYAQEIGQELAGDLVYHLESEGLIAEEDRRPVTCPPENIASLLSDIQASQNKRLDNARQHKLGLIQLLPSPSANSGGWSQLLQQVLERGTTWQEALFDTALRCAGEDDWTAFEKLYPSKEEFKEALLSLKELSHAYLKEAIIAQQLARVKTRAHELQEINPKNAEEYQKKSQELYERLQEGWNYHPDEDPDALSFLLIEYELGFICRLSQVEGIRASIEKAQFKQEICGGGKTTVLRNIIAHIRADGTTLSAISTLEPLRREHGLLFARTTAHAFGQKAIDFVFNRKSPSEEASLLKIHRNLLKMVVERGRVDLTKGDLLSFKLEMVLKQEKIKELLEKGGNSEKIEAFNRELDIMENIRDFLEAHAVINADELDKDCDATQEKIYAHGDKDVFDESKVEAGIELMHRILQADTGALKRLADALRNNEQSTLPKDKINAAFQELAGEIFDAYADQLELDFGDRELFIDYLTEIKSDPNQDDQEFQIAINQFYEDRIIPPKGKDESDPLKEKICFMHEFLTQIAPHALTKKGGVHFGRSEDFIHEIPYAGSDTPKEGSEHGLEGEQIWYALMDYVDQTRGGVSPNQIRQLVQNSIESALQEVEKSRRVNPEDPMKFADTAAAAKFQGKFHKSLEEVSEEDFKDIAQELNKVPKELLEFVQNWVLPEYQMNTKNIVSDSQDPPSMVKAYGGSSGTDYAKYSMPDSIDVSNVQQKGVHGKVIRSLIQIHEDLNGLSFLPHSNGDKKVEGEEEKPLSLIDTLAKEIQGGDCLSDVGVAFPGIPAVEIARMISAKRPELTIRFMTRKDEWKMLKGGKVIPVDHNIALGQVFTIFDDIHTRGAERPSMEGATVFVTLDTNSAWAAFEQGVLRERGVTKGQAKVRYLISPALMKKWEEPTLDQLFALLIENEAAQLKPINLKAEKQKIRAIARHGIEKAERAMTRDSRKQKGNGHYLARALIHETVNQFESKKEGKKKGKKSQKETLQYFIRSTKADARAAGRPAGKITGKESLERLVESELKKVKTLIASDGPLMEKAMKEDTMTYVLVYNFCQNVVEYAVPRLKAKRSTKAFDGIHPPRISKRLIPEKTLGNASDLDNEKSVEQEQEQEQEMAVAQELQQETSVEGRGGFAELPHIPLKFANVTWQSLAGALLGVTSLEDFGVLRYHKKILSMKKYAPYMPHRKFFTENFSPVVRDTNRGVKPWAAVKSGVKFPPDQNRVSRTLFVIDIRGRKVAELIPSLKDNDTDIEKYVRKHQEGAAKAGILFSIYNYDTDCVDGGVPWENLDPWIAKAINEQIVSTKFFNGETSYGAFEEGEDPSSREIFLNQYAALVEWLEMASMEENIDDLENSFKRFIRLYRTSHVYEGSDIQRAFKEVREALGKAA